LVSLGREGMGQGTGSTSEEVGQCLACDTEGEADSWHATVAPARGDSLRKEMSPWAGVCHLGCSSGLD
jgi:hypothetical protein